MPEKRIPPELLERVRPSVTVKLEAGGQEYTYRLSFNLSALARIEQKSRSHGVELKLVGNIFSLWAQLSSAAVLGATFWACAVNHHPEYDSDAGYLVLSNLIEGENCDRVGKALAEAYPLFLSKDKAEMFRKTLELVETNPQKPAEEATTPATTESKSIGSSSGPSADSTSELAVSANSAS